jgi:hypothetical protein
MKLTLSNHIDISGAPESLARKLRSTFTLENPLWVANEKMSRWNGRTDHWLTFSSFAEKWASGIRSKIGAALCRT